MRLSSTQRIQAIVILFFAAAAGYAKVTGPDAGYTGAPKDIGNCTACHDTFHEANVGPGSVQISNLPEVYEPGKQYTISVTTRQSGRSTFGFQITALDSSNNRAGALAPLDGTTQLNPETGFGGRQYVEHTQVGTSAPVVGSRTWQLRWTAPSTDIGTVRFYVAGNAANNDGTNQNDYIYTSSASSDSETSHVTITLQSDPGGQTLRAGSIYRIDWTTTGQSNINNIELRYSTDDGATFPISNLIVSTTDASMSSYDWTVPNKPTTNARIRISVGKKSGDEATPALSKSFAISGDGSGSPRPAIFGVSASGKKLFVAGENFMMGAVIEVNGVEKGTVNDEDDFSHMLRSKKGAKKIKPGQTASITVLNPDNQRSEPFMFTRPPE
jgi:hypothetical protein